MAEVTKFQEMNGCSACMHAAEGDPAGTPASAHGKGFWCKPLARAVDSKDGGHCEKWAYEA
jgi:hypothetical protein